MINVCPPPPAPPLSCAATARITARGVKTQGGEHAPGWRGAGPTAAHPWGGLPGSAGRLPGAEAPAGQGSGLRPSPWCLGGGSPFCHRWFSLPAATLGAVHQLGSPAPEAE